MKRYAIFALVALGLSACSHARPNAKLLNGAPTSAPVAYKQGWRDGCESGMAMTGNFAYKAAYRYRVDRAMLNDMQYYRGRKEGETYCAHYTMAVQWESGVLPTTPSQEKSLLPETDGVFAVMAKWGAPSLIDFQNVRGESNVMGAIFTQYQ
ncbi:MAG: hypothetical protein ABW189_03420 [Rickettsiales bacterium]